MCTALSFKTNDFYFGRTLDWLCGFGEKITVTGRNYPLIFRQTEMQRTHYAMIGTAVIADGYPLYFDAVNEKGLCMAGLNFPAAPNTKDQCQTGLTSLRLSLYLIYSENAKA